MNTLRRIAPRFLIALLIVLVIFEAGLRIAVANLPVPLGISDSLMIAARSDPHNRWYQHSPYWSPDFVRSLSKMGQFYQENSDGVLEYADTSINGYTERNGERLTTDQPQAPARDVWLYGNSAIWSAYTADGWTIPSYLQRKFNALGLAWRVRNMAQPSLNVTLQLYWLKRSAIKPGDTVVFIDGLVDYSDTLKDISKTWTNTIPACQVSQRVPLMLVAMWCSSNSIGATPDAYVTPTTNRDVASYWSVIDRARAYAQGHGATFYHFMQPRPDAIDPLYMRMSRGDPLLSAAPLDFFDTVHMDDDGNSAIAEQIAAVMVKTF